MLSAAPTVNLSAGDRWAFDAFVPPDHYLRLVACYIDFERFRPQLQEAYTLSIGRPAIDPVRMLKFMFLRYHYRLSDRQLMARTQTDLAFRWFLDLGSADTIPDHTNGTHFRQRIGEDNFDAVFQELITLAREHGLVNDRLRLKDATHIFANAADVTPLTLAAQVRERLWHTAEPFFPEWVAEQRQQFEAVRATTAELPDTERLVQRMEHLRDAVAQVQERLAALPAADPSDTRRQRLDRAVAVASKLLADHADPSAGDRLVSAFDADARTGKHGQFFVGYLLDLAMDADSELITAINVLPGNGAEAADAIALINQEEAAQGNDVQELSMDGVGYNGPVLHTLMDVAGLNLEVTVPPPHVPERSTFGPERFPLTVLEDGRGELTCPAGQSTRQRERIAQDTGYRYIFKPGQCAGCPQRQECLQNPGSKRGRTVIKNDYEAEYRKVQEKAGTAAYQETRRTHPKIERKLGEMARHQGMRRAHYRGQEKVRIQALLTGLVVNIKRMVRMFTNVLGAAVALPVRAEVETT